MSITVSKLCANAQANYVMKLVAGKEGLGNYVRWVHLVENADVSPFLHGNEMVFMTGVGINDEGHLLKFVEELIEKRCSALVINTGKYIKVYRKASRTAAILIPCRCLLFRGR